VLCKYQRRGEKFDFALRFGLQNTVLHIRYQRFQNNVDSLSPIRVEGHSTLGIEGVTITARKKIALLRLAPFQPQPSSLFE